MNYLFLNPELLYYIWIILIVLFVWILVRTIFKRIANFTGIIGENSDLLEELREEIKKLNTKIESLENRINKDS